MNDELKKDLNKVIYMVKHTQLLFESKIFGMRFVI